MCYTGDELLTVATSLPCKLYISWWAPYVLGAPEIGARQRFASRVSFWNMFFGMERY
jgi:hypothetical protein